MPFHRPWADEQLGTAATPGLGAAQTIDVAHGLPADALACAVVRSDGFDIADENSALVR
jgi:hypothetical protein